MKKMIDKDWLHFVGYFTLSNLCHLAFFFFFFASSPQFHLFLGLIMTLLFIGIKLISSVSK